uniref:Uncharacterized protein n=2 Tax=Alexandrium monilatum TaxID=311494 RepID=A0A7S4QA39_9DINO
MQQQSGMAEAAVSASASTAEVSGSHGGRFTPTSPQPEMTRDFILKVLQEPEAQELILDLTRRMASKMLDTVFGNVSQVCLALHERVGAVEEKLEELSTRNAQARHKEVDRKDLEEWLNQAGKHDNESESESEDESEDESLPSLITLPSRNQPRRIPVWPRPSSDPRHRRPQRSGTARDGSPTRSHSDSAASRHLTVFPDAVMPQGMDEAMSHASSSHSLASAASRNVPQRGRTASGMITKFFRR